MSTSFNASYHNDLIKAEAIEHFLQTDIEAIDYILLAVRDGSLGLLTRLFNNMQLFDTQAKLVFAKAYADAITQDHFAEFTYAIIQQIVTLLLDTHGELRPNILHLFSLHSGLSAKEVTARLYGKSHDVTRVHEIADLIVSAAILALSLSCSDAYNQALASNNPDETLLKWREYHFLVAGYDCLGNPYDKSLTEINNTLTYQKLQAFIHPKASLLQFLHRVQLFRMQIENQLPLDKHIKKPVLFALSETSTSLTQLLKANHYPYNIVEQESNKLEARLEKIICQKNKNHFYDKKFIFFGAEKNEAAGMQILKEMIAQFKGAPTKEKMITDALEIELDYLAFLFKLFNLKNQTMLFSLRQHLKKICEEDTNPERFDVLCESLEKILEQEFHKIDQQHKGVMIAKPRFDTLIKNINKAEPQERLGLLKIFRLEMLSCRNKQVNLSPVKSKMSFG